MNKSKKFRIENLILLTLVVVSIVVLCISAKITFLSIDMFILRDNANFYNESVVKTDESADYYNDNDAKRQEIYNSDRRYRSYHFVCRHSQCMDLLHCESNESHRNKALSSKHGYQK